jgi:competence protein ComEA
MKILWMLRLLILGCCAFTAQAEPVNINRADAQQISAGLKGIGPKKAEAIIAYRNQHGAFKSLHDLENVKGIGEKTVQALANDVVFDEVSAKPESKLAKKN